MAKPKKNQSSSKKNSSVYYSTVKGWRPTNNPNATVIYIDKSGKATGTVSSGGGAGNVGVHEQIQGLAGVDVKNTDVKKQITPQIQKILDQGAIEIKSSTGNVGGYSWVNPKTGQGEYVLPSGKSVQANAFTKQAIVSGQSESQIINKSNQVTKALGQSNLINKARTESYKKPLERYDQAIQNLKNIAEKEKKVFQEEKGIKDATARLKGGSAILGATFLQSGRTFAYETPVGVYQTIRHPVKARNAIYQSRKEWITTPKQKFSQLKENALNDPSEFGGRIYGNLIGGLALGKGFNIIKTKMPKTGAVVDWYVNTEYNVAEKTGGRVLTRVNREIDYYKTLKELNNKYGKNSAEVNEFKEAWSVAFREMPKSLKAEKKWSSKDVKSIKGDRETQEITDRKIKEFNKDIKIIGTTGITPQTGLNRPPRGTSGDIDLTQGSEKFIKELYKELKEKGKPVTLEETNWQGTKKYHLNYNGKQFVNMAIDATGTTYAQIGKNVNLLDITKRAWAKDPSDVKMLNIRDQLRAKTRAGYVEKSRPKDIEDVQGIVRDFRKGKGEEWIDLYHGTGEKSAKLIEKEGFKSSKETGKGAGIGTRKFISLTEDEGFAKGYASKAILRGEKPAIVKAKIRKRELERLKKQQGGELHQKEIKTDSKAKYYIEKEKKYEGWFEGKKKEYTPIKKRNFKPKIENYKEKEDKNKYKSNKAKEKYKTTNKYEKPKKTPYKITEKYPSHKRPSYKETPKYPTYKEPPKYPTYKEPPRYPPYKEQTYRKPSTYKIIPKKDKGEKTGYQTILIDKYNKELPLAVFETNQQAVNEGMYETDVNPQTKFKVRKMKVQEYELKQGRNFKLGYKFNSRGGVHYEKKKYWKDNRGESGFNWMRLMRH